MLNSHFDKQLVDEELLRLVAGQSRRVPYPIILAMALIASFAWQYIAAEVVISWLLFSGFWLLVRAYVLPKIALYPDAQKANEIAIILSAMNGIAHGSSCLFFPYFSVLEQAIQTMILLGISAGAVATTFGKRDIFIAYLLPSLLPISIMWALRPHPENPYSGYIVSVLCLMFGMILLSLAKDMFKSFSTAFVAQQEQTKLNEKLQASLTSEASANRAKTQFLAAASHDLRQPLHTVSIFCAALEMQNEQESNKEIIEHMNGAVSTLSKQLDALLDISKLDAGITKPELKQVNLNALFSELEREFKPIAQDKGIEVEFTIKNTIGILNDEVLLIRILQNLIANAIKYSNEGKVQIELIESDRISMCVSDNGPGIPEEEQERVFEEFYQLHNSERDNSKGLGLGLAIVKRLCHLLNIELRLESSTQGTRFYLHFPQHIELKPENDSMEVQPQSDSLMIGLQVLLIDDNIQVSRATQLLLENMGFTVVLAENKQQALKHWEQHNIDFVIADLRLRQQETGIDIIQELRHRNGNLPALLVSGDTAPERLHQAKDAAIKLLHKPLTSGTLEQEMIDELKRKKSEV
ncbi:hybrid sensor histidine kinase/response regulator [uncultured Pseudoteredinibacter sp.]|uniref:ATP-binding response regulator n=1 Tax=uncultured Pseudoteredinibacter sp. TaxID=1641701 RepID=UPI0026052F93|nr:hybrid sensor histidine kinase/response regulator [uncultured Pseudoteredinibacter sp.]